VTNIFVDIEIAGCYTLTSL